MSRIETPWGPWDAASLSDVTALFSQAHVPWWIAGGYAIELAVGHAFREHEDIDVLLLRRDQLTVQEILPAWEWWAADPPGTLRPWKHGEILPPDVHDIWCRPGPSEPWRIQIMLDEADGHQWISRKSSQVRRPVDQIGALSAEGVPYLLPEVQLFYKAGRPAQTQGRARLCGSAPRADGPAATVVGICHRGGIWQPAMERSSRSVLSAGRLRADWVSEAARLWAP